MNTFPDPKIGYFVISEEVGTAEISVADTEPFEDRESAERWIETEGVPGVDYWVCAPVRSHPTRRIERN